MAFRSVAFRCPASVNVYVVQRSGREARSLQDALNEEGTRAEWPEADVVVGNPPFLGTKRMYSALGVEYATELRQAYPEISPFSDLVCDAWSDEPWIVDGAAVRVLFVDFVQNKTVLPSPYGVCRHQPSAGKLTPMNPTTRLREPPPEWNRQRQISNAA